MGADYDFDKLEGKVDEATNEVRRRTTWLRRLAAGGCLLGAVGIGVGGYGIKQVRNANADRAARTIASCEQAVETAKGNRSAITGSNEQILRSVFGVLTPEQEAQLAVLLDENEATVAGLLPLRDCSPQGIVDFFTPGGPKGYLP